MMKSWWTAKELAELELPEMPKTEYGCIKKVKNENWQSRPRKKGKGNEYHISNLPQSARLALIEKMVERKEIDVPMLDDNSDDNISKADKRRDARLIILSFLDSFRKTTDAKKTQSYQEFSIIYNEHAVDGMPKWVFETIHSISARSLGRWIKSRKNLEFSKLGAGQNNRKGTGVLDLANDGKIKTYIAALIIKQPHLTSRHIEALCRAEFGEVISYKGKPYPIPSRRSFSRFITNWKEENKVLLCRETSPDEHKNRHILYMGNASEHIVRLNQLWEIDASPADALCEDGRYTLYAIEDIYSRRVLMHVSKTARSEAVLQLLRKALIEWGVPETIKTDNGTDFVSVRTMTALASVGISQDRCNAYQGQEKGHVERIFKTFQHDMTPLMPGYIGHNVGERKKIEARKSFAARMGKEKIEGRLTPEKLQEFADTWCKDMYQHRVHSALGVSPFVKAAEWTQPIKKIENLRALDLLLSPIAGQRTVTKNGIRVKNGHFWDDSLVAYQAKAVTVRLDPDDMGVIYCFDPDTGKFICEAINYERAGVDRGKITKAAQKAAKIHLDERMKDAKREAKRITPEKLTDDYISVHKDTADKFSSLPKPTIAHTTDDLTEAARAMTRENLTPESSKEAENRLKVIKQDMAKNQEFKVIESDEDRWYARWKRLDIKLNNDVELSDADLHWYKSVQTESWWLSRKGLEELRQQESV